MIAHALIMAGGRGLRMMPLTKNTSKAMVRFKNSMLIGNALKQLKPIIKTISITVGYKGSELADYAIKEGVNAIFNTNGKGNAWWLYHTLMKHLNKPVLVLTCDNIVEIDIDWITEQYTKVGSPPCMLVPVKPIDTIQGDFIEIDNRRVKQIGRTVTSGVYSSGIQVVNPKMINSITKKAANFYEVWEQLIRQQVLFSSEEYTKDWYSVNTEAQLKIAEKLYTK